jgi:hypothetical protein
MIRHLFEGKKMRFVKNIYFSLLIVILILILAACQTTSEPCPECTEPEPCPTVEACPACELCADPLVAEVPFEAQWAASGHADATADAFRRWDDDGIIDPGCVTCHSASGYQDFLGADSTASGSIENTHMAGNGLTCITCHNKPAILMENIVFPSGITISNIGESARCMICHQGRSAGNQVETAMREAGLAERRDTVNTEIRFYNIHYYAAAATLYGGEVNGGYQYAGMNYEGQNQHVDGYNSCTDCHDPHTLEIKIEECRECHSQAITLESLVDIRMSGSQVDYDGDGNIHEGIAAEIKGLQNLLFSGMQAYSTEIAGATIGYNASVYPYYFNDLNADGVVDEDEAMADNAFTSWTVRLLEAAYNYQTSLKDPGAYAHNPKYVIQLLFDSTADLNAVLTVPVEIGAAQRDDAGHFNSASESFRH